MTGATAELPSLEPRTRLQLARRLDALYPASTQDELPDEFDELLRLIADRLDH